jgi:hypothetical protein
MRIHHCGAAALAFAAMLATGGPVSAEEMKYMANLSGGEEVPPVETAASGTADITYDSETMELSWTVEFSGLSGTATAAHFHGPAPAGENAGPVITIEDLESPSEGSATLTEEQAAQLAEGVWYVNVHTQANPGGEIRGQVQKGP